MSEIHGRYVETEKEHIQRRRAPSLHVHPPMTIIRVWSIHRIIPLLSINDLWKSHCLPQDHADKVKISSSSRQRQTSIHRPAHVSVLRPHDIYDDFLVEVGEHALQRPDDRSLASHIASLSLKKKTTLGCKWKEKLTQQPTSTPSP